MDDAGIEQLILDFDGTLTDVDQEAVPFVEGYKGSLAKLLQMNTADLQSEWDVAEAEVLAHPAEHGWRHNGVGGVIVAPAYADLYLRSRAIAILILTKDAHRLPEKNSLSEILNNLFGENYLKSNTCFKPDAEVFLRETIAAVNVAVATNSNSDSVTAKLRTISFDPSNLTLCGNARKYVVDHDGRQALGIRWNDCPVQEDVPGFGRPVYFRRPCYHGVLEHIRGTTPPKRVAVMGDVYELDLALPQKLGMHIILAPKPSTPQYEIDAVLNYRRGHVVTDLRQAQELVMRLKDGHHR